MDKVNRYLEDKLEATRGPAMPPDVEARVRQRIAAATGNPAPAASKRHFMRASYGQVALLLALLLTAGWVVRNRVMPVVRAVWERAHCLTDPSAAKR